MLRYARQPFCSSAREVAPLAWVLAAAALGQLATGCVDGCEADRPAPAPATFAPATAPAPPPPQRDVPAATAAIEGHLGLLLPPRDAPALLTRLPAARGLPFTLEDLNRRFWVSWGPRGLVANERALLAPGALVAADLKAKLDAAIPDWKERSGVDPKGVLVVLDEDTDPDAAATLLQTVAAAGNWRVMVLVLEEDGVVTEVSVPPTTRR